jgi:hypothetical protein
MFTLPGCTEAFWAFGMRPEQAVASSIVTDDGGVGAPGAAPGPDPSEGGVT